MNITEIVYATLEINQSNCTVLY